jgi:hypothetical protein
MWLAAVEQKVFRLLPEAGRFGVLHRQKFE